MAKMKKLEDLFHDTLKDVYFAEKKILASLPKMAKAAQHTGLKAAFEKHHGETEGQIERLEQVFAEIEKKPQGKTCDAIVGIAKEGQEIMEEYKGMPAHDAGLDFVAAVFRLRGRFRDFAAAPLRTAVVFCAHPVGASVSPLLGRGVR